jgi:hypothetical protein
VPLQRVLDDLGDPKDIAAMGRVRRRLGLQEVAAVILLPLGGFIFVAGWIVGLILLWASPRWRWPDKLLGTLVWPFGYAGVLYGLFAGAFANAANNDGPFCGNGCTSTSQGGGMPTWLEVLILVAAFVPPAAVVIWLVLRARWVPDQIEQPIPEPART